MLALLPEELTELLLDGFAFGGGSTSESAVSSEMQNKKRKSSLYLRQFVYEF